MLPDMLSKINEPEDIKVSINIPDGVPLIIDDTPPEPKKRGRKRNVSGSTGIITPQGDSNKQQNHSYNQKYQETDNLLRSTIAQIDMLSSTIEVDVSLLRNSKTARGKYTYISNLVSAQASLIGNKISAIREMDSNISKAMDMEYKVMKDMKMSTDAQNDDKAVMDLYAATIKNPDMYNTLLQTQYQQPHQQSFSNGSTGIITGDAVISSPTYTIPQAPIQDNSGFNQYINNMTPEQHMMLLENDPNVEEVVCYDPSTGAAYFDVVNLATGESVPNTPKRSQNFMDTTIIDPTMMLAKNNKLGMTWKVIAITNQPNKMNAY